MNYESMIPDLPRENANALTCDEIAEILPHRYPFALVDRILDMEPGQWAVGRKCVSGNEAFFCGHFPEYKVMPGVLILEAMAQVGAVALLCQPENRGKLAFFGGVKNARFKYQVTPGDVLELRCEIVRRVGPVGYGMARAFVDGKLAAQAELTFALSAPKTDAAQ
ncbi:3-hydroxyacyl-ACP dehydratase FabZ [uncultured Gemmiger sp.]|uniref:3-hydroxyacyl-ACP dehydratase FabZ n=1 Tax=uncultured Gemmiger sp. TaxID=1623490 RepID=UPI0025DDE29C|nr:3-hydroxyacyl-ACP dehydratase FabZ [uncultured Gemmiger sp.]